MNDGESPRRRRPTFASWLACRLGLGHLPRDATWSQLFGIALLGGIGFTVSLFVADLAFEDVTLADDARLGILVASLVAALLGSAVLAVAGRARCAHSYSSRGLRPRTPGE